MKGSEKKPSFKGRYIGLTILVIIELLVGIIHIFFGLAMLIGIFSVSFSITPVVYIIYTLIYGCLMFFFGYLLWKCEPLGWAGTIAVSLFVIVADTLTVFNLVDFLGIPKIAAFGEIPLSILIICHLIQSHVRLIYKV